MPGFDDLVLAAKPALAVHESAATEGRSWRWEIVDIHDGAGDPVDLTGTTGVCTVYTRPGGSVVTTLSYAGGVGELVLSKAKADTVGLAGGLARRQCCWGLVVTESGGGQRSVQFWGPAASTFTIETED